MAEPRIPPSPPAMNPPATWLLRRHAVGSHSQDHANQIDRYRRHALRTVESFAGGRGRPREANLRAGAPAVRFARRRTAADAPTAVQLAAGRPAPTRLFFAAAGLSGPRPGVAAISAATVGEPHRRPVRQLARLISIAYTRLPRRTPVRTQAVATGPLSGLDIGGAAAGALANRQKPGHGV